MMPLPNRLPVPDGFRRRDAAAEFAKLELRDGGAWLMPSTRAPKAPKTREPRADRAVGRLEKAAQTLAAFLF